eukprot:scaffold7130_cov162-Skeletonema_marinoi.AAC.1
MHLLAAFSPVEAAGTTSREGIIIAQNSVKMTPQKNPDTHRSRFWGNISEEEMFLRSSNLSTFKTGPLDSSEISPAWLDHFAVIPGSKRHEHDTCNHNRSRFWGNISEEALSLDLQNGSSGQLRNIARVPLSIFAR